MKTLLVQLQVRPRLLVSAAAGVAVGLLLPASLRPVTRALLGWNAAVWLYLPLIWATMARLDHGRLRRMATTHAEGAGVVLMIAVAAAIASLAAIMAELSAMKSAGSHLAWPHLLLPLATVVGSWLLLPTEFALSYASRYFLGEAAGGMDFPGIGPGKGQDAAPDYSDFLYFSLTVAATAQTSDVAVTTRAMRKLVTVHAVLSFAFNTLVLALAINMAAGLF